jgi:hypothetical protein
MVNVKFACQLCQSWQPEMRLDYSGTKTIQIFIVTNRLSHSWSRCILGPVTLNVNSRNETIRERINSTNKQQNEGGFIYHQTVYDKNTRCFT